MQIELKMIDKLSELAKLDFDEKSKKKIQQDLDNILEYVSVLSELDTSSVDYLPHMPDIANVMREDAVLPSLERELLLKNAQKHSNETVIVPKTVE